MQRNLTIIVCCLLTVFCSQVIYAEDESIPCGDEPMTIHYGDVVACKIDPAVDLDTYFFNGKAGNSIVISILRSNDTIYPCLELTAPDNSKTVACNYDDNNRINAVLDQTGTFSVLVRDYNYSHSGEYMLSIERVMPESSGAQQIFYNEHTEDEINPVGDLDLFYFEGIENTSISLLIARSSDTIYPCLELTAPDNSKVVACNYDDSNRIDVVLDQTGTFSVLVRDYNYVHFGDYSLTLQCVSGPCLAVDETCAGKQATIVGNANDNVIVGTQGNDVIVGMGGNDIIYGLGGNDRICGGNGDDVIDGGDGRDVLRGEKGNDVLRGGAGRDTLVGGSGNDTLDGGGSRDRLSGNNGNDTLYGASGNDKLSGGNDSDICDGGSHKSGDTADETCECAVDIESLP